MRKATMLAFAASISASLPVSAQVPPQGAALQRSTEGAQTLYIAERNQLGLLEYCQEHGWADAAIITMQRRLIALIPPAPGLGETEEAAGRGGIVAFAAPQASFADDAKAKGISVKYDCEQVALRVAAQAEQLPK